MNAKIVLIPLASLAVIGTAALLHQRTPPVPAPICIQADPVEPMVEVESIPTRRFARPPAPPTPPPAAPDMMPVA
jgi:hypothetical protein